MFTNFAIDDNRTNLLRSFLESKEDTTFNLYIYQDQ